LEGRARRAFFGPTSIADEGNRRAHCDASFRSADVRELQHNKRRSSSSAERKIGAPRHCPPPVVIVVVDGRHLLPITRAQEGEPVPEPEPSESGAKRISIGLLMDVGSEILYPFPPPPPPAFVCASTSGGRGRRRENSKFDESIHNPLVQARWWHKNRSPFVMRRKSHFCRGMTRMIASPPTSLARSPT